ncbi:MAG: Ig-like domain repeat protein [Limnohabitans sp.]|nr:Ig-like domain repeat protein [Limnohabitans sp.]
MSKTYKIKLNQGQGEAKFLDIPQAGGAGNALTVKAVAGGKYQLVEVGTGYAPENIRAMRSGKNLLVFFEGRNTADLMIENYYDVTPEGFNGLIGEAESGRFYEYIPETAVGFSTVAMLAEGSAQVGMALGGSEVFASGAAVGTLVAAAGLNPLLLAPLALLGAGGGGSKADSTDTTPPEIKLAQLLPEDDSGQKDNVTNDNTPRIEVQTEPAADVSVEVAGKTYKGKADDKGLAVIQIPDSDALKDGAYTPKVTSTDAAGNAAKFDGKPFTVDTKASENNSAQLHPEDDSGPKDNVTNDTTPRIQVQMEPNAEVSVEVAGKTYAGKADDKGMAVIQIPDADALKDGTYTPKVTATDIAGNVAKFDGTPFTISTALNGPNKDAVVDIKAIDIDSGHDKNDFITNDNQLVFKGTVKPFTDNGDWVKLDLKDSKGNLIDSEYVKPVKSGADWAWSWDRSADIKLVDGEYKLDASVVNGAGIPAPKPSTSQDSQDITIDTKGADGNNALSILSMTVDSGVGSFAPVDLSRKDYKTNDNTPVFTGGLDKALAVGEWVEVQLIQGNQVIHSDYIQTANTSWTWVPSQLLDGTYTLKAQVVDLAGNPAIMPNGQIVPAATQVVVIDTLGSTDGNDPNHGLKTQSIAISEDTAANKQNNTDFVTSDGGNKDNVASNQDDKLTFTGALDGNFTKNGGKIWVQILDNHGNIKSNAFVEPDAKSWSYQHQGTLAEGMYVAKTILFDHVGNMISAKDQAFQVDITSSDWGSSKPVLDPTSTIVTYNDYFFNFKEYGNYRFENSGLIEYKGGEIVLPNAKSEYAPGTFKLEFWDQAGNITTVANAGQTWKFGSPVSNPTVGVLVKKDFTGLQTVGAVGKYEVSSDFDMASLYDGISSVADQGAASHVVLSNTKDVALTLSLGDVLALGVTNSFSVSDVAEARHKGQIQMLIDGQQGDVLNLDGWVNASDLDWAGGKGAVDHTPLNMGTNRYDVYSNNGLGVVLFVDNDIKVNVF